MLQPNFKFGWIFRGAVFTGLAALFGMAVIPAEMGVVGEPDIPPLTAKVRAELIDALDVAFRKTYVYEDKAIAAIALVRARQRPARVTRLLKTA